MLSPGMRVFSEIETGQNAKSGIAIYPYNKDKDLSDYLDR